MENLKSKELNEKKYSLEEVKKIMEDLKDNYDFKWWLFMQWYYIDNEGKVFKVYYKIDWKKTIWIKNIKNPVVLKGLWHLLINKKSKEKFIFKEIKDLTDIQKEIGDILFYTKRSFFELAFKENIKNIPNINIKLEKFLKENGLTFPDVLKIYIYWGINKKDFLYFMDKVLNKQYLRKQLEDERFARLAERLIYNEEIWKQFLSECKKLNECFNTSWDSYTRFNLYVRLKVIERLSEKGIIPKEKYEEYKTNIKEIVNLLKEIDELNKKKKEEENNVKNSVKEHLNRLDEFLWVPEE